MALDELNMRLYVAVIGNGYNAEQAIDHVVDTIANPTEADDFMRYEPDEILAKARERAKERASQKAPVEASPVAEPEPEPEAQPGFSEDPEAEMKKAMDAARAVRDDRPEHAQRTPEEVSRFAQFLKMMKVPRESTNYYNYYIKMIKDKSPEQAIGDVLAAYGGDTNQAFAHIQSEVSKNLAQADKQGGDKVQSKKGKEIEELVYDLHDDGLDLKQIYKKLKKKGYNISPDQLKGIIQGFSPRDDEDDHEEFERDDRSDASSRNLHDDDPDKEFRKNQERSNLDQDYD